MREITDAGPIAALVRAMGPEGDLVELRLSRDRRAFGARQGLELTAYGWLTAGPEWIGEVGLEIRPDPGEAYLWNCVTCPPYRLQGLFKLLVVSVTAIAQREGLRRLWIASLAGTAESALPFAGFMPEAEITAHPDRDGWLQVEPGGLATLGGARSFAPAERRHH